MAQAYGLLSLEHQEHKQKGTAEALRLVARETIQVKIKGWAGTHPEDLDGQNQYLGAIQELLSLLDQADNRGTA